MEIRGMSSYAFRIIEKLAFIHEGSIAIGY